MPPPPSPSGGQLSHICGVLTGKASSPEREENDRRPRKSRHQQLDPTVEWLTTGRRSLIRYQKQEPTRHTPIGYAKTARFL